MVTYMSDRLLSQEIPHPHVTPPPDLRSVLKHILRNFCPTRPCKSVQNIRRVSWHWMQETRVGTF